jgi:hypothetical protein
MLTRYRLKVLLEIQREEANEGDPTYWRPTQERLSVSEEVDLGALDFLGVMGVMGSLHESLGAIKPAAAPTPEPAP